MVACVTYILYVTALWKGPFAVFHVKTHGIHGLGGSCAVQTTLTRGRGSQGRQCRAESQAAGAEKGMCSLVAPSYSTYWEYNQVTELEPLRDT